MHLSSPANAAPTGAARAQAITQTSAYYLAFIALGLTGASLGPTLPGLAAQTGARLGEVSTLFAARSLGYMLGSLGGGRLYDRVRGHPVMAGALAVMAAMMAAVPLVPRLWLLGTVLLALGIAEGSLDVGGNAHLVWVHGPRVAPFMNGLHFFFGVGSFISPIVVAQVALHAGGIAWTYRVLAVAVLPAALWLLRVPTPTRIAEAREAGRRNVGLAALVAAFLLCYVGAEIGFAGWIYTYATAIGLAGPAAAAYLTSAFWGAFTLGRLAGIPIATRFSPRTILLADLAGSLASVSILLALPHSPAALWLGTVGLGLAMASIFPAMISLAERRMAITGQVAGRFFMGVGTGSMVLPWLIGQAFEPLGPRSTMSIILAALVAAAAVLAALELRSGAQAR